jgi:hypothetical protein
MKRALPEVPAHLDSATRIFLTQMRNAVIDMQKGATPPDAVTNLRAIPIAGGVIIQFTRPLNADSYTLYWNKLPEIGSATPVDIGAAAQYQDNIGDGGVRRYYFIKAKRSGMESLPAGPVTATSLALNTPAVVPDPPPPSTNLVTDDQGNEVGGRITGGVTETL